MVLPLLGSMLDTIKMSSPNLNSIIGKIVHARKQKHGSLHIRQDCVCTIEYFNLVYKLNLCTHLKIFPAKSKFGQCAGLQRNSLEIDCKCLALYNIFTFLQGIRILSSENTKERHMHQTYICHFIFKQLLNKFLDYLNLKLLYCTITVGCNIGSYTAKKIQRITLQIDMKKHWILYVCLLCFK